MNSVARCFAALAAFFGMTAVILGAFAAHALKARLAPEQLQVFETGARYQMYHALALLAVALLIDRAPSGSLSAVGWLFAAGIVLFSGSLYLLSLVGWKWLGPVTPLGGLCFIAGWMLLFVSFIRSRA